MSLPSEQKSYTPVPDLDDEFRTTTFGPLFTAVTCPSCRAPEGSPHGTFCPLQELDPNPKQSMAPRQKPVPAWEPNPKQAFGDKKVPVQLVPSVAIIHAAVALREGATKYGAWNYRKAPVEAMTYVGAVMRHLGAYVDGEDLDPDPVLMPDGTPTGLPQKHHLAGAIASLCILIDAMEHGNLIDNRPESTINYAAALKSWEVEK